ncbi:MAG: sulfite exporter TauE/SafE family protein, partial [Candidatus Bathyarchaeia archaeon]
CVGKICMILCLIAVGFFIGILSGFFGFGGGFILTPFLISLGFPANVAVGTSVTEIFMSSIIASLKHKRLGNVEMRVSLIIALFSLIGTELGAQIIEQLKKVNIQQMNFIVSLIYILILTLISIYMIRESLSSGREKEIVKKSLWFRVRMLKIPPSIVISQLNTEPISIWAIAIIGFIGGLLAGFLGVGGGFLLVPLLIYVIGCKPPIAAGTCTLGILISCAYASLTHTFKGNVDFISAILIFVGSSIGVQIGAPATRRVKEATFKLAFGLCLSLASLSIIMKLISDLYEIPALNILSQIIIFSALILISSLIILFSTRKTAKFQD